MFREKVREERMFKIFMCHGDTKNIKEKIVYSERTPITENTNVGELIEK